MDLAPIVEDCQSWTHSICTLCWFALTSRPSKFVQILKVYIYEWKLLKLPTPLNKLPPHSYTILRPQNKLPPNSYVISPPLADQLLAHFPRFLLQRMWIFTADGFLKKTVLLNGKKSSLQGVPFLLEIDDMSFFEVIFVFRQFFQIVFVEIYAKNLWGPEVSK